MNYLKTFENYINQTSIKTWKDFYDEVPLELQTPEIQQYYRKLFSLARKNNAEVYSDGVIIQIVKEFPNGFKLQSIYKHITEKTKNLKLGNINFNILICPNGFEIKVANYYKNNFSNYNIVISDGKSFKKVKNLTDIIYSGLIDINYFGNLHSLVYKYNTSEYMEKIDYSIADSYACYLVIKDFLNFRVGQIIDFYIYHFEYEYYNRNPKDLFFGGHYYSKYDSGPSSIACDLNKITLTELENIDNSSCNSPGMYNKIKNYFIKINKKFKLDRNKKMKNLWTK